MPSPSPSPTPQPHLRPPKTTPLTTYLYTRLHQLSCTTLHGVPGDYNLTALDHLPAAPLTWTGNCNELNAGYAADGYARIKGLGALLTAFGVGELSALNAIGGAYAERVAVVHIVGTPPRRAQRAGVCLHHSLGDGDFGVFARMAREVTVARVDLGALGGDEEGGDRGVGILVGEEVDRVLRECVVQSRPVYIELPTDMVNLPVDAERLATPIDTSPAGNQETEMAEEVVLTRLLERIVKAEQPLLIIDGFTARYSLFAAIDALVRLLGWPTTSTPFGKSCVDETLANFHGIYAGIAGRSVYKPWVDACDLVLRFGGLDSDVNTYGFSTLPPEHATINFHRDHVVFGDSGERVENVHIRSLLTKLLPRLQALDAEGRIPRMKPYPAHLGDPRAELAALAPPDADAAIEQHDFWQRISAFFREGDVILTETGTPSVGSREFVLPRNARLVNSSIWLSIGYMLAAAQGAGMAVREILEEERSRKRGQGDGERVSASGPESRNVLSASTCSGRTILFEGDGSFQMSAQELSTVIKHQLDLTLFLINNDGYTIERFIHGMKAHYNDVARWRYLDAPYFFGGDVDQRPETNGSAGDENGVDDRAGDVDGDGDAVMNGDGDGDGDGNGNGVFNAPSPENRKGVKGVHDAKKPTPAEMRRREYKIQTYQARTWGELLNIIEKEEVKSGKGLCMIEVFMDREDAPESLKRLVRNVVRRNSGESDRVGEGEGNGDKGVDRAVEEKVMKAAG